MLILSVIIQTTLPDRFEITFIAGQVLDQVQLEGNDQEPKDKNMSQEDWKRDEPEEVDGRKDVPEQSKKAGKGKAGW